MVDPVGVYFAAFSRRLFSICTISVASTRINGRPADRFTAVRHWERRLSFARKARDTKSSMACQSVRRTSSAASSFANSSTFDSSCDMSPALRSIRLPKVVLRSALSV